MLCPERFPVRSEREQERLDQLKSAFLQYMFLMDLCNDHCFIMNLLQKRFNFNQQKMQTALRYGFKNNWKL